MDFKEQVYSVLIVSTSEKLNTSLKAIFTEQKYTPIRFENSVSSAKRAISEREYDFVIINSPLPDNEGIRFSIDLCTGRNAVVMLLVRNELYDSFFLKTSPYGVFTLPKPTSKQILLQGLDWMVSSKERLRKLEQKSVSLEDKMQEIRIVNRAKWLLIENLKTDEASAHRYIEKQAMDKCISKKEIAEEIIEKYS